MLEKLKKRWKVNGANLILIIITFAVGGSLCGFAGRKILVVTGLEKGAVWLGLYILLVTLLWPFCVLLISIPLGQFSFFKRYLLKVWARMFKKEPPVKHIAIFASGTGSNAQKIIDRFRGNDRVKVSLIVCNVAIAGTMQIAKKENIPVILITDRQLFEKGDFLEALQKATIDLLVLAGFLWKIPVPLIDAYPNSIINIHPALLPKYGGKGMYGDRVHTAVINAKDLESGITIHYVDEVYDHGKIIFTAKCPITSDETPASLAKKIHLLEHEHYPVIIEKLLNEKTS